MRRLIPTVMFAIGLCSSAAFAGLAPTKPSQLADLTTTYATPYPQDFPGSVTPEVSIHGYFTKEN